MARLHPLVCRQNHGDEPDHVSLDHLQRNILHDIVVSEVKRSATTKKYSPSPRPLCPARMKDRWLHIGV